MLSTEDLEECVLLLEEVTRDVVGDELAALGLDERAQPQHVGISVDDGRDVLVCVDDTGLLADGMLGDQEWVALESRDLPESQQSRL